MSSTSVEILDRITLALDDQITQRREMADAYHITAGQLAATEAKLTNLQELYRVAASDHAELDELRRQVEGLQDMNRRQQSMILDRDRQVVEADQRLSDTIERLEAEKDVLRASLASMAPQGLPKDPEVYASAGLTTAQLQAIHARDTATEQPSAMAPTELISPHLRGTWVVDSVRVGGTHGDGGAAGPFDLVYLRSTSERIVVRGPVAGLHLDTARF